VEASDYHSNPRIWLQITFEEKASLPKEVGLAEKEASPRVRIFEGSTAAQPQAEASAEASPKLSYLEVKRKISDSCI
jgi:hypothetical protein